MDISTTHAGCLIVSDIVGLAYHAWPTGTRLWLEGKTTKGDGFGGQWCYDADSMATHDGYDVLRQTIISSGDPGRWLRELQNANWSESDNTKLAYINNKPTLATVATSGLYSDLSGTPTVSPIGSIIMYGGSSAPTGYLLCDGTAVSRSTYSALFAITSTAFGTGDGSTTFNLPDLRQRFPLGKAASGTGSTLGGTGGTIDHLHTIDPASTATSSDGSHNHTGVTGTPSTTVAATNLTGSAASTTHTHTISSDGAHTHTVDIPQFNSGTANPPYQVVNYIIKYQV